MIIKGYDIMLHQLREEHIEMVRNWRNSQKIAKYMEYREMISPDMQRKWFSGLDDLLDFYFVIEYNEEFIGLIHVANINWALGSGDAGLFIYDNRYLNTHIPVLSSLSMLDALFSVFPLQAVTAKVMAGNDTAAKYNTRLGFQLVPGQEGMQFQQYRLEKEVYNAATEKLRGKMSSVAPYGVILQLSSEEYGYLKSNTLIAHEELIQVMPTA